MASSGGGVGGYDPYDPGSMPNTPGRVEGPERSIVAGALQAQGAACCRAQPAPPLTPCRPPRAPCPAPGFVGELEGELTVDLGDRVKVHSEVDGWARVIRLSDNRTGLVPSWAVSMD